jgi:phage gpG-like protein
MATQLQDFRNRLAVIADPAFRTETNKLIGLALEKLALKEFRQSENPYGVAWKPVSRRAKRGGLGKPLIKSGALRASHVSDGAVDSVRIGFADPTAIYAQKGTRPSLRAARAARQNGRGRFVSASAKTAYLLKISAHTNPGAARRQILPESSTGGLPIAWINEIRRVHAACVRRRLRAA